MYVDLQTVTEGIIQFINSNLGLIGAIASSISVPLAIILYIKNRQKQKMLYSFETNVLISNFASKYRDIKIFHNEKEIENLFVAKIYLWNAGNKVINCNDIATREPVCIQMHENLDVLNCEIISMSNSVNNAEIDTTSERINLKFDYFAKNDGVIIQVLYTGKVDDIRKLRVAGIVKEQGKIQKASTFELYENSNAAMMYSTIFTNMFSKKMITLLNLVFIPLFVVTFFVENPSSLENILLRVLLGFSIFILTISIFLFKTIPKKLK